MIQLTEYIDQGGLQMLAEDILLLSHSSTLTHSEQKRLKFIKAYVEAVDAAYSPPSFTNGRSARQLKCVYKSVHSDGGRMFCKGPPGPHWDRGRPSYVCIQGMPRCVRPYLLRNHARDIDCENCHVSILYQLTRQSHEKKKKSSGLDEMPALSFLYHKRSEFFNHISSFHSFECESYSGEWKDKCKSLVLRVLYGGTYDAWSRENGVNKQRRSPLVRKLEKEMKCIQRRVLSSREHEGVLSRERWKRKNAFVRKEVVARRAFAILLQTMECRILLAMKECLETTGWTILSLVFDGLIAEDRPGIELDVRQIESNIFLKTKFRMRVTEKSLLHCEIDPASLLYR